LELDTNPSTLSLDDLDFENKHSKTFPDFWAIFSKKRETHSNLRIQNLQNPVLEDLESLKEKRGKC